jgi:tetratricopeptide (TPR) repeat protein
VRQEAAFALRDTDVAALPAAERAGVERAFAELLASHAVLAELPEANFNRGVFLAARGDAAGAEAAYRAAIARWPADLPPRQNLAQMLVAAGRSAEAAREFEAVLARDPGWPPAAFARALLHAEAQEWAAAAALLEACLARDPQYPRAAYNLGLAYAQMGDPTRAAAALERATSDPAARRDALRERVRLAHVQGDEAAQQRWLPEALLADPNVRDDPRVREALGTRERTPRQR